MSLELDPFAAKSKMLDRMDDVAMAVTEIPDAGELAGCPTCRYLKTCEFAKLMDPTLLDRTEDPDPQTRKPQADSQRAQGVSFRSVSNGAHGSTHVFRM